MKIPICKATPDQEKRLFPAELEKGLIIPDVHAPYHNKKSWKLVEKVVRKWKPKRVVILGDFFDCYAVSQHRKDPSRKSDLAAEIREAQKLLNVFDEIELVQKDFIEGNHEWRLPRWLMDYAKPLYEMICGDSADTFGLKARGWTVIPYMDDTEVGALSATHDLEKAGWTAVEDAMQTYIGRNAVIGHVHTFKYAVRGNAKGVPFFGASFGWLGDLESIDYRHKMKAKREYVQGFGTFRYNPKNKFVYLMPTPIVNGTACVEGELYSA